jgi:hypothetical protein
MITGPSARPDRSTQLRPRMAEMIMSGLLQLRQRTTVPGARM